MQVLCKGKLMTRCLMRLLIITTCAATMMPSAVCQRSNTRTAAEPRTGHEVVSRVPPTSLAQLSGELQQLASKVSPAVVQIEVSGFGAAEESGRKETALIVRQHAIGAG